MLYDLPKLQAEMLQTKYSIEILDKHNQSHAVLHGGEPACPCPPASSDRTNVGFEPAIQETVCAERGDILRIVNTTTGNVYHGCLFPHHRHGGQKKKLHWYSEVMLCTALLSFDGSPCAEFESAVVFVDHLDRINDVRLVPKGCTIDDGDEDFDPEDPMSSNSPSSALLKRGEQQRGEAGENANPLEELLSPRRKRIKAAFEEHNNKREKA